MFHMETGQSSGVKDMWKSKRAQEQVWLPAPSSSRMLMVIVFALTLRAKNCLAKNLTRECLA